jgi:hypothetical protein
MRTLTSGNDSRSLFFLVLIVGTFFGILLKNLPVSNWLPMLFFVSVQFFYAWCVMKPGHWHITGDRAGDSFYYLGLLFTLVSLAHTLWAFGDIQAGNADQTSNDGTGLIISGFGIALGTTIVGLALRVLVQQFKPDTAATDNEVRESLNALSRQLSSEIGGVIQNVKNLKISIQQEIQEGVTNAKNLKGQSQKVTSSLTELVRRFEEIEFPKDIGEKIFGPARDEMKEMAISLSALEKEQRTAHLNELSVAMKEALSQTEEFVSTMRKSTETIPGEFKKIIDKLSEDIVATSSKLDASTKSLGKSHERSVQEIEKQVTRAHEASGKLINQVVDMADEITKKLS